MDVSSSRNCSTSAAVRTPTLSSPDSASKCQRWILCLCQIAMFATASWCPPSSPPSLFPASLTPRPPTPLSAPTLSVAAALRPLVLLHRQTACGPACPSPPAVSLHGLDRLSRLSRLHRAGPVNPIHHAGPGHSHLPTLSLYPCHPSQPPPRPLHRPQHPPLLLSLLQLRLRLWLRLQCSPARPTGQAASVSQLSHQLQSRLKSQPRFQLRPLSLCQGQHQHLPPASIQVYQCGPATLVGPITRDSQDGLGSIHPSCLHTGFRLHRVLS